MATKPVKVLADLQTRKQILKLDNVGNILFKVSGSLGSGVVFVELPMTASAGISASLYGTASYALNAATASYAENAGGLSVVYTSGNIAGSGTQANPIYLQDPLIIGAVTASSGFSGFLFGTASFASTATSASFANSASTASYALNAVSSSYALTASLATGVTGSSLTAVQNAYNRLRYQTTGSFDATGSATVMLPTASLGAASFPIESFNYVDVSVMVKQDTRWINDLISVQMYTSSTNIYIEISAPALTNTDQYKLLAVNENSNYYLVI